MSRSGPHFKCYSLEDGDTREPLPVLNVARVGAIRSLYDPSVLTEDAKIISWTDIL